MITKEEILEYLKDKPHINVFPKGQFWRVRVGERSVMPGDFTRKDIAERAMRAYVGTVIEQQRKRQAKREAKNAKKDKS